MKSMREVSQTVVKHPKAPTPVSAKRTNAVMLVTSAIWYAQRACLLLTLVIPDHMVADCADAAINDSLSRSERSSWTRCMHFSVKPDASATNAAGRTKANVSLIGGITSMRPRDAATYMHRACCVVRTSVHRA